MASGEARQFESRSPVIPFNPHIKAASAPPVMEARRWVEGKSFPAEKPLLNLSQAAPTDPPPEPLRQAMAEMVLGDPSVHLYGPVLGLPDLRDALAAHYSDQYQTPVGPTQLAITAGCNEAFAAAIASLAGPGDEVLLPVPWYFNHKMWLDMAGIRAQPLATDAALLPDLEIAATLLNEKTRALVLVSPNNPGGVEYPADYLQKAYALAHEAGIALILDETYRDFHSADGAPHRLFSDPDWDRTLISLYSFSKAYRLTGHRVGALLTSPRRLAEVEKFLDTVTICPPQLGQKAALWGLTHLGPWLQGERRDIVARKRAMVTGLNRLRGWRCLGAGAYFAYVEHPFDIPSPDLARLLVDKAHVLALPGTMFRPEKDAAGARELRFAFANIDADGLETLFGRLAALG
ncbi:MAG: aminotransferase [Pseudomonadota bacterium]